MPLRYAFAVVLATAGMLVTLALTPDDAEMYAVLVGVAAVTAWFGGLGPAALTLALGWAFQLLELLFVSDDLQGLEVTRWLATLGIGLAVVLASEALRRGREQASTAASTAEASFRDMVGLQELATTLLDAVTPSDVAQASSSASVLVGARGASFGLVEGSDIVIVDPRSRARRTSPVFDFPWKRKRRSRRRRAAGRRSRSKVARRSSGTSRTARRSRSTRSEQSQFPSRLRGSGRCAQPPLRRHRGRPRGSRRDRGVGRGPRGTGAGARPPLRAGAGG